MKTWVLILVLAMSTPMPAQHRGGGGFRGAGGGFRGGGGMTRGGGFSGIGGYSHGIARGGWGGGHWSGVGFNRGFYGHRSGRYFYPGFGYFGFGYGLEYGYGYPFYYPAYSSGYYDPYAYADPYYSYQPAASYAGGYGQPSEPVIVNQYFHAPRSQEPAMRQAEPAYSAAPVLRATSDYYLIAFPNGSIALAVAYWTEGGTLHYVTRHNREQKQVAINAIDRDLTQQLNAERGVEFRIPR